MNEPELSDYRDLHRSARIMAYAALAVSLVSLAFSSPTHMTVTAFLLIPAGVVVGFFAGIVACFAADKAEASPWLDIVAVILAVGAAAKIWHVVKHWSLLP